jgi:hypothetical protein
MMSSEYAWETCDLRSYDWKCDQPSVFVEENLSTAVFMIVAGATLNWPAQDVDFNSANMTRDGQTIPAACSDAKLW